MVEQEREHGCPCVAGRICELESVRPRAVGTDSVGRVGAAERVEFRRGILTVVGWFRGVERLKSFSPSDSSGAEAAGRREVNKGLS